MNSKTISLTKAKKALIGRKLTVAEQSKPEDNRIRHLRIDDITEEKDGFSIKYNKQLHGKELFTKSVFIYPDDLKTLVDEEFCMSNHPNGNFYYVTDWFGEGKISPSDGYKFLAAIIKSKQKENKDYNLRNFVDDFLPPEIANNIEVQTNPTTDEEKAEEERKVKIATERLIGKEIVVTYNNINDNTEVDKKVVKVSKILKDKTGTYIQQLDKDGKVIFSEFINPMGLVDMFNCPSYIYFPLKGNNRITFRLKEKVDKLESNGISDY